MADFLAALLASLFGGLIPERGVDFVVAILMLIATISFVALAGFTAYQGVVSNAGPFTVFGLLFFLGLAWVCFRLMIKGFRSANRPKDGTKINS